MARGSKYCVQLLRRQRPRRHVCTCARPVKIERAHGRRAPPAPRNSLRRGRKLPLEMIDSSGGGAARSGDIKCTDERSAPAQRGGGGELLPADSTSPYV